MDKNTLRILMLEDNPVDVALVQFELEEAGIAFAAKVVMTEKDFIHELQMFSPDIILSDYDLPAYNGALALEEAKKLCPDIPFILVTGAIREELAIETLTSGAQDYVMKSRLNRLAPAVKRALTEAREHKARKKAEKDLQKAHRDLEVKVKERTKAIDAEIAKHKKTEEALLESTLKYKELVANANSIIIRMDQNGTITFFNDYAQTFFGYNLEEILGKDVKILLPHLESSGKNLQVMMDNILSNPDKYQENINENILKNGKCVWVSWRNKTLRNSSGHIIGNLAVGTDITERRQAEEALRESEKRYRRLWETMLQGVVHQDATGLIIAMNPAAENILGKTQDQLLGSSSVQEEPNTIHEDGSPFSGLEHPSMEALRTGQAVHNVVMRVFNQRRKVYRWINIDAIPLFRPAEEYPFQVYTVFEDITERKQTEQALRQSEENFKLIAENTPDHILVQDTNLRYVKVINPQLGLTEIDMLGKTDFEILSREDAEKIAPIKKKVIATGESVNLSTSLKDLQGITQYFEGAYIPRRNAGGEIDGLIGYFRNVTENKKTEQALQDSETKANALIKYAPTGIHEIDSRGSEFKSVNDAMCRILGYTREELFSIGPQGLLDDNSRKLFADRIRRQRADEKIDEAMEYRVRKKDGTFIHATLNVSFNTVGGEPGSVMVVVHDITARKQSEEKLRESENLYHSLFENMLDGFAYCRMLFDSRGNPEDFIYLAVNDVFASLTGLTNVVGKKVTEVIPEIKVSNPELMDIYGRVALTGRPERFEINFRPLNKWLLISAYQTKAEHFVALFEDITEHKLMEETQMFLATSSSADSKKNFFELMAQYLARTLEVDYVCIDRLEKEGLAARTVAVYFDGKFEDNVAYTLKDTPCGDAVGKTICIFAHSVRHLFPRDAVLQEMMAESYAGTTLWGSQGQPIGLIALLWRKPLANLSIVESILKMVSVRATRELERLTADEKILTHNKVLEGINRIFEKAITCETEEELGGICLEVAEGLTESMIGFVGDIGADGCLYDITISNPVWKAWALIDQTGQGRSRSSIKINGLYWRVLTDGKSLLVNDPASHADSIGLPEGHPPLTAFLGAPLIQGGNIIGMIGMGNRSGGYGEEQREILESLAPAILQVLLRKRAEIEINALTKRLSYHVDHSPLAVIEWGPDMRLIRWSGEAERIFGWRAFEVLGKRMEDFKWIYNEDEAHVSEVRQELQSGTNPRRFSANRNYHKDGSVIHCEWYNSSMFDDQGKLLSILSLVLDVTQRKQMEEAVLHAKQEWERTFDAVPDLIAILDDHHHIVRTNRMMAQRLRLTPEQCIGKVCHKIIHGTDCPPAFCPHVLTLADGEEHMTEVYESCLGGDFLISTTPMTDGQGRRTGSVHVARDITAMKKIEEVLKKRTAQLEAINKELESFSYFVSHDLRAPLRAIDGYTKMILRKQGDKFNEENRRQFDQVRESARAMGQLIDDLLTLSKLDRQDLDVKIIDVRILIEEIWQRLQRSDPDRRMTLKMDILPPGRGDRGLLKQVFINLLSNALKFTRTQDKAVIEVGGYENENENGYYVKDNGVGFDMKYHDKMFGAFQRLHSAAEYEGTGIGLAIVQRIVHHHGGRVWAEGKADEGAVFYFTLPRERNYNNA